MKQCLKKSDLEKKRPKVGWSKKRDRARDPKIWMIEWRPQGVKDLYDYISIN